MDDRLLLGLWRFMLPIPRLLWQRQVGSEVGGLDFMLEDHRRVHHFAVRELPRLACPMEPGFIARELDLPLERVAVILTELEQKMTFLFRDDSGAVTWAYPVTVDRTPHRVTFSSGEQIYAA